ncbi:MAG: helicase [Porticoccus sp.]|nr:helicase [Porticoccus sp.]
MQSNNNIWSKSYELIKQDIPQGYSLSKQIHDAKLFIKKSSNGYRAIFTTTIKENTKTIILESLSIEHNWVLHKSTIYPLPPDINTYVINAFKNIDLFNLDYQSIIKLKNYSTKSKLIDIEFDDEIFASGEIQSEQIDTKSQIIRGLDAKLYPYQAKGVAWMKQFLLSSPGLILADEMGLGKTMQIIALLLSTPPKHETPALIICRTTLIENWKREIHKFAPTLSVTIHHGTNRSFIYHHLQQGNIVISTYTTVANDIELLKQINWNWVICDEAQDIKNPESKRRIAISELPRNKTIPMTGTPVENSLKDFYSIVDIAIPGILGNPEKFDKEYPDTFISAEKLNQIASPLVLRRMVKQVANDLPERLDIDQPLNIGDELANKYNILHKDTIEEYETAGHLVATLRLQMFCAHPWLQGNKFDTEINEDANIKRKASCLLITPKIKRTIEIIEESFKNNKKVIIFAEYNKIPELIFEAMDKPRDIYWNTINGSTDSKIRQNIVDEFSNYIGNACLVLNPRAAGSGLNIVAASVIIHYTQPWNPAVEMQASARAHRIGQKVPVTIYRLFYIDTVEEVIIERSRWKRELSNEALMDIRNEKEDLIKALKQKPQK